MKETPIILHIDLGNQSLTNWLSENKYIVYSELIRYCDKLLKDNLAQFDPKIAEVEVIHGPNRAGDIPHSLASIEKAKSKLGYNPKYSIAQGIKEAVAWYYTNLK